MHPFARDTPTPGTRLHPRWRAIGAILLGCAGMFLLVQLGTTWLAGMLDLTWASLIV